MTKALIFVLALICTGCSTGPRIAQSAVHTSPDIAHDVQPLLDRLYQSFNYGPGQEPDWRQMRAAFLDGAQFVPEPESGAPLRSYDIDALIAKWQSSLRSSPSGNSGYSEWIHSVSFSQVGKLVRADIVFYGKEPGDPHARQPGLDSLLLARVDGSWRVISFVVHKESKL